ncbi:tetratricopeptide repeat protein (plasmid) [Streptomyces phaeoluteigriseus]|uniref:Tetratricopeptide repeat protein n=1 Tax=Streptomyces phaeoluteigriseus TaxID=114686 RepID=A0ABY4ZL89_9ACTN|nr:tetratricopeptide repeat protein [Streptomyces phaeoluteigriseus]USQ89894.1 tetratricopeptide repeat protein [Streptomyces phaeoluteigriseus]
MQALFAGKQGVRMTQVGRPHGELKGETPQADELAQWLRALTRGVSQRDLAQLLHIGKTLCSEYLNGSKLIPEDMIDRLVDACVPDVRLREQGRDAGRLRRQRAVEAARGKPSVPPLLQRARTPAELHLRLDDARRGQLAAQEKTFQAERMVGVLLSLVASLQERCARLEAERERAASVVRGELQHELEQSELRLESARTLLEEARREREQAEEIRLAAHRMVERERQALKDAEEEPHPAADSEAAAEPGVRGLRLENLGLAALNDVDRVLDASSAQLAAQAQELDALGEHVGLAPRAHTTSTPQTPAIARSLPAGNTANPPTSPNIGRDQAAAESGDAITAHTQAVDIHRELGDRYSEGMALHDLGVALQEARRFDDAITAHTQAVNIYRALGNRHGEGRALDSLGNALQEVRRFHEAITALTQAVDIYRALGNRHGEGRALDSLGVALQEVRSFDEAITAHNQAVDLYRALGDRQSEAFALNNLGNALQEVRRFDEAIAAHNQAADIYHDFGDGAATVLGRRARTAATSQTPAIARALLAGNAANPPASSNTGRDRVAAEWEAARRQALANVATAMSAALVRRRQAAAVVGRRARTAPGGGTDKEAEQVYANWDSPLLRGVEGNPRHHTVDEYDTYAAAVHALHQLKSALPGVQKSEPRMLRLRIDDADNEFLAQRDFWIKVTLQSNRYRLTSEPVALRVGDYRDRRARGDRLGRSAPQR